MRSAINSSVGGRNNVKSQSNLNFTGANGTLTLCKADFSADKATICAGETIQFTDDSYNEVTAGHGHSQEDLRHLLPCRILLCHMRRRVFTK